MQIRGGILFIPMDTPINAIFYTPVIEETYIDAIMKEIYRDKIYAPFFLGRSGMTVIDIGANIGMTSMFFSKYAKVVHAVEPSAQHYNCLAKMVEFNKLDNIKTHKYAVSGETGTKKFYHNSNVTMFSLNGAVSDGSSEDVDVVDMGTLFKNIGVSRVDFMKLDVEGSEFDIIGSQSFRDVASKIKVILVEYHSWSGKNPGLLVQSLESCGFTVSVMPTDASIFVGVQLN